MGYLNKHPYVLFFITTFLLINLTLNQYHYSDDYQFLIGIDLYNKINNQNYLPIKDLFLIRSDGHFIPFGLVLFDLLPINAKLYNLFTIIFYFLATVFVYKISNLIFNNPRISLFAGFLFIVNYSISIKALSWNCFNSHITNSLTGFMFIYYFLVATLNQKKLYYLISIPLGLLTVLNFETGLFYPVLLFFLLIIFYKEKNIFILFLSIFPIISYFVLVLLLKENSSSLLLERLFNNQINFNKELNIKKILIEYRARNADRDLFNYFLRIMDNSLSVFNLSIYEFTMMKFYIEKKIIFLICNFLLFIFSIFFYVYLFFKFIKKKLLKDIFLIKIFFLLITTLLIYSLLFFRKDINLGLAFTGSLFLAYYIEKMIDMNKLKLSLILIFFLPSLIYASTKFEYIYEMQSRSEIRTMNNEFEKNLNLDLLKLEKHYFFQDYLFLHLNENFDKYQSTLKDFKYDNFWEFQENFYIDFINKIKN